MGKGLERQFTETINAGHIVWLRIPRNELTETENEERKRERKTDVLMACERGLHNFPRDRGVRRADARALLVEQQSPTGRAPDVLDEEGRRARGRSPRPPLRSLKCPVP